MYGCQHVSPWMTFSLAVKAQIFSVWRAGDHILDVTLLSFKKYPLIQRFILLCQWMNASLKKSPYKTSSRTMISSISAVNLPPHWLPVSLPQLPQFPVQSCSSYRLYGKIKAPGSQSSFPTSVSRCQTSVNSFSLKFSLTQLISSSLSYTHIFSLQVSTDFPNEIHWSILLGHAVLVDVLTSLTLIQKNTETVAGWKVSKWVVKKYGQICTVWGKFVMCNINYRYRDDDMT